MSKSGGVDIEEHRTFAESAGCNPSKLHAHMNAAVLIREIWEGVKTGVLTDGTRPGVDWSQGFRVEPEMGLTGIASFLQESGMLNYSIPSQSMDYSGWASYVQGQSSIQNLMEWGKKS